MTLGHLHALLVLVGNALAGDHIPQRADEGPPLTVADEVAADAWLERWFADPAIEIPPDQIRRALVPRFRYALPTLRLRLAFLPPDQEVALEAEARALLLTQWYSASRATWLREPAIPEAGSGS